MTATPSVFAQRITSAQSTLKELGLAACLVPSSDPHLSEYLPARWQGREWLSGFTGSMGTLVVTRDRAALFADSRYWTQAETELAHTGIELVKIDSGASTHHVQWLAQHTGHGKVVGVDGAVLGLAAAQQLRDTLARSVFAQIILRRKLLNDLTGVRLLAQQYDLTEVLPIRELEAVVAVGTLGGENGLVRR